MRYNNIEDFRELLKYWASEKNSSIFSNGDPLEANAVIGTMYEHSSSIVRFFATDTSGIIAECDGCGEFYFQALDSFLSKPHTQLKVLIERKPDDENKRLFKFLKENSLKDKDLPPHLRKIDFRFASKDFLELMTNRRPKNLKSSVKNDYIHYTTGDNSMFRIEYDSSKNTAKFSFNNEEITAQLIQDFDSFFYTCEQVNN